MTIAVIGAGMAGLACAASLAGRGERVAVFDKGRGLGGRLATRRSGPWRFDHGAQYVTAREPVFRTYLEHAAEQGHAALWVPAADLSDRSPWWVGTPGMSGLVRPLAEGLDIATGCRVEALEGGPGAWQLVLAGEAGKAGPFDSVMLCLPAPQAAELAGPWSALACRLETVAMAPCWTAMLGFERAPHVAADVLTDRSGVLAWCARNASRPARPDGEAWVLHASAEWSRAHLEADPDWVLDALTDAFAERLGGGLPAPVHGEAHRWRHARVTHPLEEPALWDGKARLGLAGDWCLGARVEAAWTSGRALAALVDS